MQNEGACHFLGKNQEKRHMRHILARFWNCTCKEKSLKLKKHKRQNI